MKHLSIDFGLARLGLAVSDPDGRLALPHRTLERKNNDNRGDLNALLQVLRDQEIAVVVCGVPSGSQKSEEMASVARRFFEKLRILASESGLELDWHETDEQFTTAQVLNDLKSAGISQKSARESGAIDAGAATVMLQSFLDARSGKLENPDFAA